MNARNVFFASLTLTCIACGPATEQGAAEDVTASGSDALTEALNATRHAAVVAAFEALDPSEMNEALAPTFAADAVFATVDMSSPLRSSSFGHTTFLLVPAGSKNAASDPNDAHEFYVAFGRSTNTPARNFGPFQF
jgi:hypothetical protein